MGKFFLFILLNNITWSNKRIERYKNSTDAKNVKTSQELIKKYLDLIKKQIDEKPSITEAMKNNILNPNLYVYKFGLPEIGNITIQVKHVTPLWDPHCSKLDEKIKNNLKKNIEKIPCLSFNTSEDKKNLIYTKGKKSTTLKPVSWNSIEEHWVPVPFQSIILNIYKDKKPKNPSLSETLSSYFDFKFTSQEKLNNREGMPYFRFLTTFEENIKDQQNPYKMHQYLLIENIVHKDFYGHKSFDYEELFLFEIGEGIDVKDEKKYEKFASLGINIHKEIQQNEKKLTKNWLVYYEKPIFFTYYSGLLGYILYDYKKKKVKVSNVQKRNKTALTTQASAINNNNQDTIPVNNTK
jgi:hypothetical protein